MLIDTSNLPDNPEELKKIIFSLEQKYQSDIDYLQEKLRLFQKELFGRKSEKQARPIDHKQLQLFDEVESCVAETSEKDDELVIAGHKRKKPKRKPLPEDLPRQEVIHDLQPEEKICACGAELSRIGQEVSEKLDIVPAKIRVIRHIRYKYACKSCEGVEDDGPTVKIAPMPPQIIDKSMATSGLLAYIATAKYVDALPLYRQEKIFLRYGIHLSRATMAGWMVKSAQACAPVISLLQKELLSSPLINADETPVQVLRESGRANTTKSYMWVFRGGPPDKPVVLFRYAPTRSGDIAREMLADYKGYVQCDAFSGYDILEGKDSRILLLGCFAHTRRNFVKVLDARGKSAKAKTGSADVALKYIGRLYKVEKFARENKLSPKEIYLLRQEKSKPILEEFKAWIDKRISQTPPKGLLGKALEYAHSNWKRLIRYIDHGYLKIDNNDAENAIRPFVIGRKNWLFSGHPNGAHASATLYSLIETAKACGLEPYKYLRFLFKRLPYAESEADYKNLLPQYVLPEYLKDH